MLNKIKWSIFLGILTCTILFLRPSVFSSLKQDETLLGTDSNKNGIRDDIEEYIQKRFSKSEKRKAALYQLAKDYQNSFAVYEDLTQLKSAIQLIDKSHLCIHEIFGQQGLDEIHALMAELFSNQKRSEAGIRINNLLYEKGLYLPERKLWIKECRFDAEKMSNY